MENNIFASKIKKVRKWFVGTQTKAGDFAANKSKYFLTKY